MGDDADRPTLVYDDDCGFCTWATQFVVDRADVVAVGFSELTDEQRERLPDDYEACAHLLTVDAVYSCGEAMVRAFELTDVGSEVRPVFSFLRNFDDYDRLRERAYRIVADNRSVFGTVLSADPPASGHDDGDGSGESDDREERH